MSAAANAAAFLSMRRRLPEDPVAKAHFTPAPEPAGLALVAASCSGAVLRRRRRRVS